jgi:ligand-binding sensor domain-containing protein
MLQKMAKSRLIYREDLHMPSNLIPPSPSNPPGLNAIAYRISDYSSVKRRLLEYLHTAIIPNHSTLARLRTRDADDAVIALIDSWAMVIDILTFYQERIANEGYWRTAVERQSIIDLARAIGCELKPGVAASTYLKFTVDEAPLSPSVVTVPKGTQIQSIPSQDELPQTFETSETFTARADWNTLKPRNRRLQEITPTIKEIYLQGTNLQLQVSDYILLIDESKNNSINNLAVLKISNIEIIKSQYARITFTSILPISTFFRNPHLFAFRQRAALFGNVAPKWEDLPDEIKRQFGKLQGGVFQYNGTSWNARSEGLPTIDIRCLAINSTNNCLFAGTAGRGIYRSIDNGLNWTVVNVGLTNFNVESLYCDEHGYLLAGTPGGGIFRSKDNGENWSQINIGTIEIQEAQGANDIKTWQPVNTGLPNTIVRCFIVLSSTSQNSASQESIYVGTDDGVFYSTDSGKRWQNIGLQNKAVRAFSKIEISQPSADEASQSPTIIEHLFAATDSGIFQFEANNWKEFKISLESNSIDDIVALVCYEKEGTHYLFADTKSHGIFRSTNIINTTSNTINESNNITWVSKNPLNINVKNITTLAVIGTTLFAGALNGQVSKSNDDGDSWIDVNINITDITALAGREANQDFQLFAGTKFAGFAEKESDQSNEPLISLDNIYPKILADSWIVLVDNSLALAYQVKNVLNAVVSKFTFEARVTQIEVIQTISKIILAEFQPLTTIVLAQSELLTLAKIPLTLDIQQEQIFQDPITENSVFLNQFVQGLESKQKLLISGQRPQVEIKQVGGVFQWSDENNSWQRYNNSLDNLAVSSLVSKDGFLYAGTDQGVFHCNINSNTWAPLNLGLTNKHISALVVDLNKQLYAGTAGGGVFGWNGEAWAPINQGLKSLNITTLAIDSPNERENILLAGTDDAGIFSFNLKNPDEWKPININLINAKIQAILATNTGWFVGTSKNGIFRSQDKGNSWELFGYANVLGTGAIKIDENNSLQIIGINTEFEDKLAGTLITLMEQTRLIDNVNSSTNLTINKPFDISNLSSFNETTFTLSSGLTHPDVTALFEYDNSLIEPNLYFIFAATNGGGIFRYKENIWQAVNKGLTNSLEITTLAIYQKQGIGITSDNLVVTLTDKSEYIQVGSLITVNEQVRQVTAILSDTTISINKPFEPNIVQQTACTIEMILAGTKTVGMFYSVNQGESWNSFTSGLANTEVKTIAISSEKQLFIGGTGILPSVNGLFHVAIKKGDCLKVIARPNQENWRLQDINGFEGIFTRTTSVNKDTDLILKNADPSDETISELIEVLTPPSNQQIPILELSNPLQNCYDPETVTVSANVVPATHGETIPDIEEILGSGDGRVANQQFFITKPPLTYISAATADGIKSTLEVRVNGLLWEQVPSLYNKRPDQEVYIVRTEDDGNVSVTFGDGINGARLPSGIDNVIATYRSGIGLAGNVTANSLKLLKTRPLGIKEVTNPIVASGAANRETAEEARRRTPQTVRTLERIVSLQDFEDFARTFAGISKVMAVSLWSEQTQIVHLTIAANGGEEVSSDSELYKNLVNAIEKARDPYQLAPVVSSYEQIWFKLTATVIIDERYVPEKVKAQIKTDLQTAFAFEKRQFGQNVTSSEVIAVIQQVKGVIAVDLETLHRLDAPQTLEHNIPATFADWDSVNQKFIPTQLLALHSSEIFT